MPPEGEEGIGDEEKKRHGFRPRGSKTRSRQICEEGRGGKGKGSFFLPSFELPFSDTRRKAFLFEGRGGMAARFIINQVSS